MNQQEKAWRFLAMHHDEQTLVLPNCWDGISAKVLAHAGFGAIATASASMSWARGKKDGENLDRDEMLDIVKIVCGAVDVPVSADIEKGFGDSPQDVKETVLGVLGAGAVGINIEDSLEDGSQRGIEDMQARIAAARQAGNDFGVDLVINARVDGFLLGGKGEAVLEETFQRGQAWRDAGADCIFVPGVEDLKLASTLAANIGAPLNLLVMSENMPTITALNKAGVARISTGPRLMQAVMGALEKAATSIREDDDFRFLRGAPGFADLDGLSFKLSPGQ